MSHGSKIEKFVDGIPVWSGGCVYFDDWRRVNSISDDNEVDWDEFVEWAEDYDLTAQWCQGMDAEDQVFEVIAYSNMMQARMDKISIYIKNITKEYDDLMAMKELLDQEIQKLKYQIKYKNFGG